MSRTFYNLSKKEKENLFEEMRLKTGLPPYAIEKDWWVVQTLAIIFGMEFAPHVLFKGGTSLSKAWHLIQRFSEDIDLALSREYLGFDGGLISKNQVKKLRSASFKFVTTTFYEALQKGFADKGYTDVHFDFENLGDSDQDPVSILIHYPAVTAHSAYILPRIKVEIGSRSLKDPYSKCKVISFIDEEFSALPFADKPISIPCVNPERTFLEKLFLLHEEFQKPKDKARVDRLSRHLYDIVKIYQSEHREKAYNIELIETIIRHRERFNGMRGVDYQTLFPPHLSPLPSQALMKAWEADYGTMQSTMIPDFSPNFATILGFVQEAADRYNQLKKPSNV